MSKQPDTKPVNLDVKPETHRLLKTAAAARGLTFSEAVEEAIAQWAPKQIRAVAS